MEEQCNALCTVGKLGDVDLNGKVEEADATLLFLFLGENASAVITREGLDNADVDMDGVLTLLDVSKILQMAE